MKTLEQQQAEQEATRREEEEASERLRWQLMQVWIHTACLFFLFIPQGEG